MSLPGVSPLPICSLLPLKHSRCHEGKLSDFSLCSTPPLLPTPHLDNPLTAVCTGGLTGKSLSEMVRYILSSWPFPVFQFLFFFFPSSLPSLSRAFLYAHWSTLYHLKSEKRNLSFDRTHCTRQASFYIDCEI